jgi:hypothetical protein
MAESGWSWGTTAAPAELYEYGWDGSDLEAHGQPVLNEWTEEGTLTAATYSSATGDLQLVIGDDFVSDVVDRGVNTGKWLSVSYNSTGNELIGIWWRGDNTTDFDQDAGSPSWEEYPFAADGANKDWRYIQVRVICYEKVIMDIHDVTMDGEPVTM